MLILVRPQQTLQSSLDNFQEHGFSCIGLAVQSISFEMPQSTDLLRDLNSTLNTIARPQSCFDIAIITSQFAVEALTKQLSHTTFVLNDLAQHIVCIGDATVAALTKHGAHNSVIVPAQQNSEGVLSLEWLHDVQNKRIALLKGEGGRQLIATTLAERGAFVSEYALYKRAVLEPNVTPIVDNAATLDAVVVASGEAASLILQHPQLQQLKALPWVVNSERVAKLVKQHGVNRVHISAGASDSALIKCVEQIME